MYLLYFPYLIYSNYLVYFLITYDDVYKIYKLRFIKIQNPTLKKNVFFKKYTYTEQKYGKSLASNIAIDNNIVIESIDVEYRSCCK